MIYNYGQYINQPNYNFEELKEKIWEWQWPVRMKLKWSYTKDDYEHRGILVSGNLQQDMAAMEEWINTTRSIADLVTLYDEGKEYIIPDPAHIERIFDIINEYTSFVAYKFNNNFYLSQMKYENNDAIIEVLNDVVKMQNLANRIFPMVVELNPSDPAPVEGLFGMLQRASLDYGIDQLQFDPYNRYGLTKQALFNEKLQDALGNYKAVDMERKFDPEVFSRIRKVI